VNIDGMNIGIHGDSIVSQVTRDNSAVA
jgi:hypothetical protein